jgi:nucleoside 2-deoxyribosyltransferase
MYRISISFSIVQLKNYEQVKYLASKLESAGWIHTYDWTVDGSIKESSTERLKEVGKMEYNGVKEADVVIVLTPQGGGTHTEFGMAIAFNKRIYLYHTDNTYFNCDDNTSPFYWLPQVNQFIGSIDDLADMLVYDISGEMNNV